MMNSIWIVIPAYNEEKTIAQVVRSVRAAGYERILVVDDGSNDRTSALAAEAGADVVKHMINRGVGAAILTGMHAALTSPAEVIVTFDADDQHHADDIKTVIAPILEKKAEVVLGVRRKSGMPMLRRVANRIGNFITWLLAGVWVDDSQSGFRAYTRVALQAMDLHANGYEFCTEVIREIHYRKLPFIQVPISVNYTAHSMSKGQNFHTGIGTLMKLIIRSLMR